MRTKDPSAPLKLNTTDPYANTWRAASAAELPSMIDIGMAVNSRMDAMANDAD
jgi:hypothetical protein